MKGVIVLTVIVVIVFLGFLLLRPGDDTQNQDVSEGNVIENFDKAPDFSLEDVDGNTVSLNDFKEKILVINSWAVWCPFCVDELPDFAELQKEFSEEIVVIAINRQESLSKSKGFTDGLGITDNLVWLLDPTDSFYKSIGGFSMPETIFVDEDGNIRIHKRGPMELSEMITRVNSIIND